MVRCDYGTEHEPATIVFVWGNIKKEWTDDRKLCRNCAELFRREGPQASRYVIILEGQLNA